MSAEPTDPPDRQSARRRLAQERERLLAILDAAETDTSRMTAQDGSGEELSTADQHPADAGTETQYQAQDLAVVESLRAQIDDIDAAVGRVDDGTYGRCQACGRPIGAARLDALPATRFCVDDAHLAETEAIGETTLGSGGHP